MSRSFRSGLDPWPAAVIFDCDGTLADSEPLCDIAWTSVLHDYGYQPTTEDFRACRGVSYAGSRDYFASRTGRLPAAEILYPDYWAALERLYRSRLRAFPDANQLLDQLRSRVPVAIASSSYRHRLDVTLQVLDIDGLPSVAGDEVTAAKPAPDLFLAAADLLGIAAPLCVAIEDSQPGIDAARAAGMAVLAVKRDDHLLGRYDHLTTQLDLSALRTVTMAISRSAQA